MLKSVAPCFHKLTLDNKIFLWKSKDIHAPNGTLPTSISGGIGPWEVLTGANNLSTTKSPAPKDCLRRARHPNHAAKRWETPPAFVQRWIKMMITWLWDTRYIYLHLCIYIYIMWIINVYLGRYPNHKWSDFCAPHSQTNAPSRRCRTRHWDPGHAAMLPKTGVVLTRS